MAISYLLDRGFRKIGLNIGPENTANSTRRLSGALKAMMDRDVFCDPKNIFHGNYNFEGGYRAGSYFYERDIDAIFSFSDMSSYGLIEFFSEKGVRLPEDISIISYDNLFMDYLVNPKLTSVDQNIDEIAIKAIDMVDNLIKGELTEKKVLIKPKIVERESVREVEI